MSLECFLEFTSFFSNCPVGSSTPGLREQAAAGLGNLLCMAGAVTATCPVPPSPQACPGNSLEFAVLASLLSRSFQVGARSIKQSLAGIQPCVDEFEALRPNLIPGCKGRRFSTPAHPARVIATQPAKSNHYTWYRGQLGFLFRPIRWSSTKLLLDWTLKGMTVPYQYPDGNV